AGLDRHPVAARDPRRRLLLSGGHEGAVAIGGLREPGAVVEVDLLDGRHGPVRSHQIRLEAGDVTVPARLLDGEGLEEDVVLAGLDRERPEGELQAAAVARIALVLGTLPALPRVLVSLVLVAGLRQAVARREVEQEV